MAERSAAEQLRALVEAAEREAALSREGIERVAERAEELVRRSEALSAGVSEAAAALKSEIEALRAAGGSPPAVEEPAEPEAVSEPDAPAGEPEAPPVPEGARLLALKMALDGRPREETAGYLRENFELDDPEALLDEVYARAGG